MSQLTRKLLNLFCANKIPTPTDNIAVFGSKKAGSANWSADPDSIQSAHYLNGWNDAVVNNQAPCMDDMNAVQYLMSYMIKYLYQTGIPEWLSTEEYYQYALVQYNGSIWFSIYNGQNTDTPQNSSSKWSKLTFPSVWASGKAYSAGDLVNYNGKGYKCASNIVSSSSNFVTDFYAGYWDDGNPAGTLIQSIAWGKSTTPYHYFDVTGSNAGQEVSISTYGELYEIIGTAYNNCVNYNTGVAYGDPASGNFRLPDFRNTFFKNAGSNTRGAGHNASHTHSHNRGSSINLTHSHTTYGGNVPASNAPTNLGNIGVPLKDSAIAVPTESYKVFGVPSIYSTILTSVTNTTSLSIPALSISNQGSGSSPEPNYYGLKILLKY